MEWQEAEEIVACLGDASRSVLKHALVTTGRQREELIDRLASDQGPPAIWRLLAEASHDEEFRSALIGLLDRLSR
jgi:hypothetical protein